MLVKEENEIALKTYNSTEKKFSCDTLNQLFSQGFNLYEDKPAVSDCEETLTYGELDIISDEIAVRLLEQKVGKGDCVGVFAEKKVNTLANIIGILKAGGAYVPVNPDLPEERREYIMGNSKCSILLYPEKIELSDCRRFIKKISIDAGDTAYIIYTSGSTGLPKGVEITHGAVSNTVLDINDRFEINSRDVIIGLSSLCFDLSVYDIFGALSTGAKLVLVRDHRNMKNIVNLLKEEKITLWNTVPAFMEFLLNEYEASIVNLSYLRNILLSGDWISLKLIGKIKKIFPQAAVTSLGGATEASIWSIYYKIDEIKPEWSNIPYGYPLSNQQIYILDDNQKICRAGEKGEIYIGGMGVAKGYINNEEMTNKAFVHAKELGYIYKTGDYGIFKEDGYVEFCGRIDSQIKINGFRIEIGEIESQAVCCNGIKEAKVVSLQPADKSKLLGMVYTRALDSNITANEIKRYLQEKLPYYSIPLLIKEIEEIPVTLNGKIDVKAIEDFLLKQYSDNIEEREDNELEKQLIDVWRSVLENSEINRYSDFFILGGNSLKAMRVMEELSAREIITEKLPLNTMFLTSTIIELAEEIAAFNQRAEQEESDEIFEEGEI
ncbi:polyketide synthase PksN/bacitracin synthase 1 [Ruminiclostridium sufflavum DSM 19573]|uniref:Polyketide synthase PksN/bacitracin synthase 1 n=1 Tax=Ruminiclostridium sufflavum DSM 19573 TaxID=1121337 RepID=A0A318Y9W1_9FIRM|nr:amino acid adenylation domain-containing protein [Ruminiclostridium sufflavum]PYG89173.1 polyketide synthase PksN/bacitracin synthase 1 [Ruminiclostridium sufflavum DSM 19573]